MVRAAALGVGKPDVLLRTGVYRRMPDLPAVIGNEMAGHVAAVGPGVSDFAIGQSVLVFGTGGGHHAELTSAPADIVTALPGEIDQDEAVCIPNYAIAWCLLCEVAPGRDDRIIYVNGASGGVGSAVVDLARDIGMTVIAGAGSADKCLRCRVGCRSHDRLFIRKGSGTGSGNNGGSRRRPCSRSAYRARFHR